MRKMVVFGMYGILLCMSSCDLISKNTTQTAEEIANRRIDTINWNEVDRFPFFENCDEMADKQEQQNCFEITFSNHVINALNKKRLPVEREINDTVFLELRIDHEGKVNILTLEQDEYIKQSIPELERILKEVLRELPKIYPAVKKTTSDNDTQMVTVATRFRLPVVIDVE
ncbi:hypothetical protein [Ascidiimonas aurantiaca]|uniref:hypothetical protein n=1 Tax=Ascidiimonas aurantiaca TaxID=1685432 RepID=UPI0030EEC1DE